MKQLNTLDYFYNTQLSSPLEKIFDIVDTLPWTSGVDNDAFQVKLDQDLIYEDEMLSKLHDKTHGVLGILMLPSTTMYNWHTDRRNMVNINLINSMTNKHTFFKTPPGYHELTDHQNPIEKIHQVSPFFECPMTARQWSILNTLPIHAGINFDTEPKYMVQYSIKKDKSEINFSEIVEIVKSIDLKNT